MAEPPATSNAHLETIDYKPPAKPASTVSLGVDDEKKSNDDEEHRDHDDQDAEDDAKFDLYSEEAEWDEGGKSHCGYSEVVHSTLMSVGETVHNMVGDPSPRVEKELKAVGNWFQEASYAARDLLGGAQEGDEERSSGMGEDAMDAVKTLLRGGSKEGKDMEQDENKDPTGTSATTPSSESQRAEESFA